MYTDDYLSYQEYRISHLKEQLRVIVDDNLGRRLSIPEEYPIRFHLLQHGKGIKDITFNKVYKKLKLYFNNAKSKLGF